MTHTHAPQLNPGDNFEVILKLRLAGTSGGYTNWINYSEIKSMQSVNGTDVSAQDVDSDPNGNTPGRQLLHQEVQMIIISQISPKQVIRMIMIRQVSIFLTLHYVKQ